MHSDNPDADEVLELVALLLERSSASIRSEIQQARTVVADAIGNLCASFDELRDQTRSQETILLDLIHNMNGTDQNADSIEGGDDEDVDEATTPSTSFGRFVTEIEHTLRFFVDQMLSVSTESMTMVHHVDDLSCNMDDVVALLKHVDGIVSKTNFLALNAHIEAARAGEAGRAFEIVADEVRGLSRESSHFSKEIRRVVEESKRGIEEAREKVGEIASQDMTQALSSQSRVRDMLEDIAQLNHKVTETIGTVQDIANGVAQNVAVAVRSLQFEDIVVQLLDESDHRLSILESLQQDINAARKQIAHGEGRSSMAWLKERLVDMHQRVDATKVKVTQSSVDEGSVELF